MVRNSCNALEVRDAVEPSRVLNSGRTSWDWFLFYFNACFQGCVFTKDINKAIMIADAMETGTVQINSAPARGPDHFPFQVIFCSIFNLRHCCCCKIQFSSLSCNSWRSLQSWIAYAIFVLNLTSDIFPVFCRVFVTVELAHKVSPTASTWWRRPRAP